MIFIGWPFGMERPQLPPEPKGWTWAAPDPDPLTVEDVTQQLADHGIETAAWGYRAGYAAREAELIPLAIILLGVVFLLGLGAGVALRGMR